MKAQAKLFIPVHVILVFIAFAAANDQASLYIYIVSPDNLPVSDKVCYPHSRKVKKQPALTNLVSQHIH